MTPGRIRGAIEAWRARRWLRSCAEVGADPRLEGRPSLGGGERIRIGARFHLASVPSPSHMVTGPKGFITIGDDVSIGHGAAIAAHVRIGIGDGTRIAPYVIILDTDFHAVGDQAGHSQAQAEAISIGRGVRIGSHVTILRGAELGDGAIVTAGSVVSGKVPAGVRVSGVPARVAMVRAGAGAGDADASIVVPEVVRDSFGLEALPGPAEGKAEIGQWDSLGALRLLLALEDTLGLSLNADDVMHAGTVGALIDVVERSLARAETAASGNEAAA
jgi:acetyltransferase-like isoleucine patch superfamily enzyme/acyl carrier protein